jgi:hypothetical protein
MISAGVASSMFRLTLKRPIVAGLSRQVPRFGPQGKTVAGFSED